MAAVARVLRWAPVSSSRNPGPDSLPETVARSPGRRTRTTATLFAGAVVALQAIAAGAAAEPPLQRYEFEQIRFAAPARLIFYAPSQEVANHVSQQIFARLKDLDRVMSDYDPDSDLSRLCRESGPGRPVPVSDDLWAILKSAEHFSSLTGGAFDASVGPLVRLWRKARRSHMRPPAEDLREALAHVGWKSVRLTESPRRVELLQDGMQLDLGGIAQGFAADDAFRVFHENQITRALIDISGDIRVGDPPPGESGWRIAIQSLRAPASAPDAAPKQPRMLALSNAAVSTSGDAYNFVEIDGQRYSHIVDPQTGLGLTIPSSVTVIAPDCLTADAVATAVSVMGAEPGLKFVESQEGSGALFATLQDDRLLVRQTPNFSRWEIAPRP